MTGSTGAASGANRLTTLNSVANTAAGAAKSVFNHSVIGPMFAGVIGSLSAPARHLTNQEHGFLKAVASLHTAIAADLKSAPAAEFKKVLFHEEAYRKALLAHPQAAANNAQNVFGGNQPTPKGIKASAWQMLKPVLGLFAVLTKLVVGLAKRGLHFILAHLTALQAVVVSLAKLLTHLTLLPLLIGLMACAARKKNKQEPAPVFTYNPKRGPCIASATDHETAIGMLKPAKPERGDESPATWFFTLALLVDAGIISADKAPPEPTGYTFTPLDFDKLQN